MEPGILFPSDSNVPPMPNFPQLPTGGFYPGQVGSHHFSQPRNDDQFFYQEPSMGQSYSPTGSAVGPSDSISQVGEPSLSRQPSFHSSASDTSASSAKRRRAHQTSSSQSYIPVWTEGQQAAFERGLARITASAGFALNWVENPEVVAFFQMFMPQATLPSRGVLTRRIIPQTLNVLRKDVRQLRPGALGTLQADGWTGLNSHHLIAFMFAVEGKVYTVRVHDASSERKTAEHLLQLMLEVIESIRKEWGVEPIAFTTDASGESRKARRLLLRLMPHLIVPDCYAHQVNLIVGDYFKVCEFTSQLNTSNCDQVDKGFLKYSKKATDLIGWLRSKTFVLALIRKTQIDNGLSPLSIIRAVLTRWTAHYLAYCRLLAVMKTLQSLALQDSMRPSSDKLLVTGDKKAKEKALAMVRIINDPDFWCAIERMKNHLEPLAVATNLMQAAFCRLDEVLLTFGNLYHAFNGLTDHVDRHVQKAVLASIELRWSKCDQDVFIAAWLFNMFLSPSWFKQHSFLSIQGILTLFSRLHTRFFPSDSGPHINVSLMEDIQNYFGMTGRFIHLASIKETVRVQAMQKKQNPDPLAVYNMFSFPGQTSQDPPFIRLAKRILSVTANSASCERLFSVFGNTLTKLRNRLGTTTLSNLAELKMLVRDEHIRSGESKQRLKRKFGDSTSDSNTTTPPVAAPAPSSVTEPENPTAELESEEPEPAIDPNLSGEQGEFASMASEMVQMLHQDEDPVDIPSLPEGNISIKIAELFDFSKDEWGHSHIQIARNSLNEEVELSELVDKGADGETIELDAVTEAVLGNF